MLGNEPLVIFMNLSRLMAEKMDEPILYVCGWINYRIAIVVTKLYSQIIHRN